MVGRFGVPNSGSKDASASPPLRVGRFPPNRAVTDLADVGRVEALAFKDQWALTQGLYRSLVSLRRDTDGGEVDWL